jgi:Concanavalin A-like lectin/glucanases superfamily
MTMKPQRALLYLAGIGMVTLCQCSLFFDLAGLSGGNEGGWGAQLLDADDDHDDGGLGNDDAGDGPRDAADRDVAEEARAGGWGSDAPNEARSDAPGLDASEGGSSDAGAPDAGMGVGGDALDLDGAGADAANADAAGADAGDDGGGLAVGLLAYFPFDEAGGTTSADTSGNGHTATMNGATFASGLRGNAAAMNGSNQFVSLPTGIVSGLSSFSIATWVRLNSSPSWSRVFDFGTGTNTYMFLTPNSRSATTLRFAITVGGNGAEQQLNDSPSLPLGSWQHVAVTVTGSAGTLYLNGVAVAQNAAMTLTPSSLGTTTQNWIGRSQFSVDPFLDGKVDNFRIYSRALAASEVAVLFQEQQ